MQRMFNLDKWSPIFGENGLHFSNPRPRKIVLEVNAPECARLSVMDRTGEVHFLALVEGRDTIEFSSSGEFSLLSDVEGVMIYTADGADISSVVVAPVIFTKVMQRRQRNPELEAFAHQMQRNLEVTLERQAKDFERHIQRRFEQASKLAETAVRAPAPEEPAPVSKARKSGGALRGAGENSGGNSSRDAPDAGAAPAADDADPTDDVGGAGVSKEPGVPE